MNSIFDKMYETIFGEKPSKLGTAFERFTAIALYLLEKGDVQHDARIRGELSQTLYQIDALYSTDSPTSKGMAEAKDYTVQGKKVGRGDLQKLAGALPDLKMVTEGSFFSATDYTRPARKYAEASAEITNGKRIRLYHLNIPRDGDEAGFIKTISMSIHLARPMTQAAKIKPIISDNGQNSIRAKFNLQPGETISYSATLEKLYDSSGSIITTLRDITIKGYGDIDPTTNISHFSYRLPHHFVKIDGALIEISGLECAIPFSYIDYNLTITDDRLSRFALKDASGAIIRMITDDEIRSLKFDSDGNVVSKL